MLLCKWKILPFDSTMFNGGHQTASKDGRLSEPWPGQRHNNNKQRQAKTNSVQCSHIIKLSLVVINKMHPCVHASGGQYTYIFD